MRYLGSLRAPIKPSLLSGRPGIIQTLGKGEHGSTFYIVLEDFGADSLKNLMEKLKLTLTLGQRDFSEQLTVKELGEAVHHRRLPGGAVILVKSPSGFSFQLLGRASTRRQAGEKTPIHRSS